MENPSGIRPMEFKCLIKQVEVEEKIGSIFIPDEAKDRNQYAETKARLIALSPFAFNYENYGEGEAPKPGDLLLVAKYAGIIVDGQDGQSYHLVNDKDILAVIEE